MEISAAFDYRTVTYPECIACLRVPAISSTNDYFVVGAWIPVSVCPEHATTHRHCCVEDCEGGSSCVGALKCPDLVRDGASNVCPYTGLVEALGWCESDDLGYN